MEKRIGVIAILVEGRGDSVRRVNDLLSQYGGIPYRERGVSVISITVEGTTDEVGALTGKLGMVPDVTTKSLLLTK